MCRFLAYLGQKELVLNSVLDGHENSMIVQSRRARETQTGLNADGFGLAWYVLDIDPFPGRFRSTRPAWNDDNLQHLAPKLRSNCFITHVRASTVGTVSIANCHPFESGNLAFAHNGTIREFGQLRRAIMARLDDKAYAQVKGDTDSEAFFALLVTRLQGRKGAEAMANALEETIREVVAIQKECCPGEFSRLNTALIDGENLIISRFDNKEDSEKIPLGMYYATPSIGNQGKSFSIKEGEQGNGFFFASEILDENPKGWKEVPENTIAIVDSKLNLSFRSIDI